MKTLSLSLAAALLVSGALAAAPADFEQNLEFLRLSLAAQRWHPHPPLLARVADPAVFERLINRARQEKPKTVIVEGLPYQIYIVVSHAALSEQDCGQDAQPLNALYYTEPGNGQAGTIYPVRLVSACAASSFTRQNLTVLADKDGAIKEIEFTKAGSRRQTPDPAQAAAYLADLVRLLSEKP